MFAEIKGKEILVLGGAGFIGSNLCIQLVTLGAHVTIVDSMLPQYGGSMANLEPVKDQVKINFSDIRDPHSLRYLVQDKDIIFSLAGQTSHIASMQDPITDLEINCKSQLVLLEACRHVNPTVTIVYSSTRQLYGIPQYLPVDENHPTIPVDVNGINKLAAENYYTLYSKIYGMRCISLRLTNTYGPRQQLRGFEQGFVGVFLRLALQNQKIQIFGDGLQRRDFNYIDDVVDALLLAATKLTTPGKVYNLGSKDYYSLLDFVVLLRTLVDFEYEIVPFPPERKAIDIGDYYSDYTLFNQEFGWHPTIALEDGLARTVTYFQDNLEPYL